MNKETAWKPRSLPASLTTAAKAKITVVGVPDHPGMAAEIFQACAVAEINIDMIVQNVSAWRPG
jgi:aspartokinase